MAGSVHKLARQIFGGILKILARNVGGALLGGPGIGVKAMAALEEAEVSKYGVRAPAGPDGLGAGGATWTGPRREEIWAMMDFLART